jgi:hypothetical protein
MIRFRFSFLSFFPTVAGITAGIFFLTGCASSPTVSSPRSRAATLPPPRTELVLLNVPEGSGWVAYRQDEQDSEVEDYRVVVIRQSTNELIYDSVIPLAASMATHGFELAKDDPRLATLARNVDQNIIQPLESVVPESDMPAETSPTPEAEPEPAPEPDSPAEKDVSLASDPVTPEDAGTPFTFLEQVDDTIRIGMPNGSSLREGDRLFVREPDRVIALPGTEEQILVSKGTVTGLVKVKSVKNQIAHTVLLSGYLPENPLFEVSEDE